MSEQQLLEQRAAMEESIKRFEKEASIVDACCMRKSAAYWRGMAASCASTIRAIDRRLLISNS